MLGDKKRKVDDKITGFLGEGINLSGKLNFQGSVRIDGKYEGEITADGTVIIGTRAVVHAKINIDNAIIMGEVKGSIEARERVEIQAQGKLVGDIKTPRLIINEGAVFEGNCVMDNKKELPLLTNNNLLETKVERVVSG